MSDRIKKLLKTITDQPHPVITGTVKSVDMAALTCDVDPDDGGAELLGVRLRAVQGGADDGLLVVPAEQSAVTVLMLDDDTPLLIATSTVQLYSIRTEKESLKTVLLDWLEALEQLTVTTPSGPSGVPINRLAFTKLKTRLNDLFHS